MDITEAYRVMQADCGIEAEDEVKLLRMYEDHEMGCNLVKYDQRRMVVGHNYFAVRARSGLCMILQDRRKGTCVGHAPFFCLELVEKAKPELPPITVGGREVIFGGDGCIIGGLPVSKPTLCEILERLEN